MKPYNTLIEWLTQISDTINQLITRVNGIYSVPPGGNPGQVLTKSGPADHDIAWEDQQAEAANGIPAGGTTGQILAKESNADYNVNWVDPSGGGVGDVQAGADNTFTGSNTFTRPLTIAEGTAGNHAAQVKQVTDLGVEVNAIAGASVTKDGAQTITGVKTFEAAPKVPTPVGQADVAPKSYVDTEIDTAAAETLRDAKAYTDGEADRIKDSAVAEIESADNVFTGLNTFSNPVSVGAPVADSDAATKKYVDDIKTGIDGDITQLSDNQTALQEDVQQIQNGVINTMTTTGTAGQVWTKDSGYGKWQDAQGGVEIKIVKSVSTINNNFILYVGNSILGNSTPELYTFWSNFIDPYNAQHVIVRLAMAPAGSHAFTIPSGGFNVNAGYSSVTVIPGNGYALLAPCNITVVLQFSDSTDLTVDLGDNVSYKTTAGSIGKVAPLQFTEAKTIISATMTITQHAIVGR